MRSSEILCLGFFLNEWDTIVERVLNTWSIYKGFTSNSPVEFVTQTFNLIYLSIKFLIY